MDEVGVAFDNPNEEEEDDRLNPVLANGDCDCGNETGCDPMEALLAEAAPKPEPEVTKLGKL